MTGRDSQPKPPLARRPDVLTLLWAPDCHFCEHARGVLKELRREMDICWREVSTGSAEGKALAAAVPPLRPVLLAPDGRVLAYGRLSKKRLRKELARLGGMTEEATVG